ncbi:MAG: hypothetical protein CMB62_03060 [Euryarchaeota archaeon]|nr:hypothetical protein [Euryarchaeota archaeon]|tara:strand:- start:7446 stop:7742 length:297 start_codon:yes stop_codon:yes gene_type:complete
MAKFSVTSERISKYLDLTAKAMEKVSIIGEPGSEDYSKAEDILVMVKAYHSDAQFFLEEGKGDDAFAAVNYAHGWIDCGVRLGYLDGKGDWQLFTLSS